MYQSLSSARAVYREPGPLASSLLQLPVLGAAWWEGQVEQEKAETGASTINVSFRKKKLGIQRILL